MGPQHAAGGEDAVALGAAAGRRWRSPSSPLPPLRAHPPPSPPSSSFAPPQLAPGGHLGRFCIWSQAAFDKLDSLFGTASKAATGKKGYTLPRPMMTNADLARIINSDEIQSVVRPPKDGAPRHRPLKKNPLKNLGAMLKLNPYAKVQRRAEVIRSGKKGAARAARLAALAAGKKSGLKPKAKAIKARCAALRGRWRPSLSPSSAPLTPPSLRPPRGPGWFFCPPAADTRAPPPTTVLRTPPVQAVGKKYYASMLVDSEYQGEDYDQFSTWLGAASA